MFSHSHDTLGTKKKKKVVTHITKLMAFFLLYVPSLVLTDTNAPGGYVLYL